MKKRNTKQALLSAVLALAICLTSFLGTTFAWFTDSVTSANNIIVSGNLDVELYHTNNYITAREKVGGLTDLFTVEEGKTFLWEPGAVVWENFEVANEGSLALKYQLLLNFTNATETAAGSGKTLADVLKVAVVAGGFNGTRAEAQALSYNYTLATFALEGQLVAGAASDVYGVVIYWAPSEIDNVYNVAGGLSIDLGVKLFATQLANEADSFDPDYDANASLPSVPGSTAANIKADGSASVEVNKAPSANTETTVIDAPAGAFNATDKVEVVVATDNSLFDVSAAGGVVATLDITMTVNGTESSADLDDGKYTVTTYISKGLANVKVTYTGTDGKSQPTDVTYDAVTGKLTFKTSHFSEYAVSGEALAYDVVNDVAFATIEKVVASSKVENNTVVIPEVNQEVIEQEIEKLPEEEKQAAIEATAAAKIGDKTYATLAEAFEAAKDGDTIVVLSNITVTTGITNTKTVVLDLGGKTVAGLDTITGSYGLITNKGTLTITGNGTMTVKASNNRGWNAYSSVISNTVGGKLVVENGTIEHLGGTDMAYGIDNLTNGKGTYAEVVINGGLVKSPYRAIRMFLNGIEAQNILTINGGTIEGANKSVWMQDPSANNNTGKLTVSANAVLNGDVYLYVTAGSTAWPVEVSIADVAVNGNVITGNVPAGYAAVLADGVWTVMDDVADTAARFVEQVAAGKAVITLANNIELTETVTIPAGKTIVLNLNGYTISGKFDGTGNKDMFLVKGNLTVKNGAIDMVALVNQNWNAMTTIFDITAGGVVTMDGVTAENKGGTDMNFVAHLNNWGTASFYVNNSTLKATYVAVRVFNSGYDVNNVTITNSTLSTTGNSAFWVHNYTAADFGTQEKADAQAKLLNFSFENVKFEAVKAAFRYGFTNAEYYTADGKQLVTATTLAEVMAYAKKGNVIIDAQGANLGDFNYDGTFANGTVLKNAKFTYVYGLSVDGLVVFENCEFVSDHSYSANFSDGSTKGEVIFNNCYFDGWNSFGDLITNVEMNNCTFDWNNPYSVLRFYQNAQLNNCTFIAIDGIDTNKTGTVVELNNCTGIEGKIYNNGDQVGTWIVNGADVSDTITSW